MKIRKQKKLMAPKDIRFLAKKSRRGVTLVELTIVLIIIGVIVSVLYTQIGGGTNTNAIRGNNAFRHAKLVASAAALQQQTLGCFPIQTLALIDQTTYNLDTGNSCNQVLTVLPNEFPFIRGVEVVQGQNNQFNLSDLDTGAIGSFVELTGTAPDPDITYYQITATDAVAAEIFNRCAGLAIGTAAPAATGLVAPLAGAGRPCIYEPVADANDLFGYFVGTD